MQFLNPIWLWAIAATAIPIVIHLWNTRPGRVIRVGSIALVEKSKGQSARNIKLRELILLLLRCLVIILLSILLANPVNKGVSKNSKPWLVIGKNDLQSALKNHKAQIDSLLFAGYELHNADTLFSVYSLADSAKIAGDYLFYGWDLLRELENRFADSTPAVIYTNPVLKNFSGERPILPPNLQWRPITAQGDSLQWIQQALFLNDDSIKLVWGKGDQKATIWSTEMIQSADLSLAGFTQGFDNGLLKIGWKAAKGNEVIADTGSTRILVVTGNNRLDANYLVAALKALREHSLKPIKLQVQSIAASFGNADWIFWLSDARRPRLRHGEKLFRYSANNLNPVNNLLSRANGKPLPNPIPVYQQAKEDSLLPVWVDGAGGVLLGKKGDEYIFTSRFNPAASALVWNGIFPSLLNELITETSTAKFDLRTMNTEQARPGIGNYSSGGKRSFPYAEKARFFFGIFLMLVFISERILSHKNHLFQ